MINTPKVWLAALLAMAAVFAGPAVTLTTADRQSPAQSTTDLLLLYSNDVRGEIEPCG
ncbi:hypothetical protein DaAHT2_0692 [Desulfurivibrio alkaliphilus AHT 2]|nr:hypothetical protein DaAHT2_0692 [Desulfurivibrio alkaliphilus AHT 2]